MSHETSSNSATIQMYSQFSELSDLFVDPSYQRWISARLVAHLSDSATTCTGVTHLKALYSRTMGSFELKDRELIFDAAREIVNYVITVDQCPPSSEVMENILSACVSLNEFGPEWIIRDEWDFPFVVGIFPDSSTRESTVDSAINKSLFSSLDDLTKVVEICGCTEESNDEGAQMRFFFCVLIRVLMISTPELFF